jgi:Leucine-rich repeat (LRR) protein
MKWTVFVLTIAVLILGIVVFTRDSSNNSTSTTDNSSNTTTTDSNTQGKVLDLSGKGLTEFPRSALSDKSIETLILSDNSIKSLPSEIGELTKLKILRIENNLLEGSLPGEIRKISGLVELDVSGNNMTGVPAELGQLSKLKIADFSDNSLTGLPLEISNLTQLEVLDLRDNNPAQQDLDKIKQALTNTDIRID